jgi:hypothetical protein
MSSEIKKKQAKKKPVKNSNPVTTYNDPFFIKKGEKSEIFLKKHGFPEELLKTKYRIALLLNPALA